MSIERTPYKAPSSPLWSDVGELEAVQPSSMDELREVFDDASEKGVRVWPVGGGRHGRSCPTDALVLDMHGFSDVLEWDAESSVATVEAGLTLSELSEYLKRRSGSLCGWRREHPSSTVGGLLSAWQPAPHGLWNGTIREACLGLGAMTGGGSRYRYLPSPRKSAGPDLRYLFIGGEGAFGVVTSAALYVSPEPKARRGLKVADLGADAALALLVRSFELGLRAPNLYYSGASRTLQGCIEGSRAYVQLCVDCLREGAKAVEREVVEYDPDGYYNPEDGDIRAGADPSAERGEDPKGGVAVWGGLSQLGALPADVWAQAVLYDINLHQAALWLPWSAADSVEMPELKVQRQMWRGATTETDAAAFSRSALQVLKAKLDPAGVLPAVWEGGV